MIINDIEALVLNISTIGSKLWKIKFMFSDIVIRLKQINIEAELLKITSHIIMERAYKINFECNPSMEVKKA